MATNSQGLTVSISGGFGDIDFEEVVSVSVDSVACDAVEVTPRTSAVARKRFRPADTDEGTVSIVMRAASLFDDSLVGEIVTLSIVQSSPSATFWDGPAILQSFAWRATVGELQEYSVSFKLGAAEL